MRIGIIGAGQLGQMLGFAARAQGFTCCFLDPGENPPAAKIGPVIQARFDDRVALSVLAEKCDVVTYEFENVPVDIGILERADNVEVVPASFEWDDVGSWLALDRLLDRDADGNVVRGEHVGVQTRNCIVIGRDGHVTATLDVEDLIIVCTKDATLVAPKNRAEDVKKVVERLKELGRNEYL